MNGVRIRRLSRRGGVKCGGLQGWGMAKICLEVYPDKRSRRKFNYSNAVDQEGAMWGGERKCSAACKNELKVEYGI